MSFRLINVGIAEFCVSCSPDVLRTILGFCVGICLHEKAGGLPHIMLPSNTGRISAPRKYADTAIPLLVETMSGKCAARKKITAKITGGSKMFSVSEGSLMGEIGKNNVKKVRGMLKDLDIEIIAEDTGGDYGRTVNFF